MPGEITTRFRAGSRPTASYGLLKGCPLLALDPRHGRKVGWAEELQFENRAEALGGLAKDAVGDIHPPRRRVNECLHGGDLANDQDRDLLPLLCSPLDQ